MADNKPVQLQPVGGKVLEENYWFLFTIRAVQMQDFSETSYYLSNIKVVCVNIEYRPDTQPINHKLASLSNHSLSEQ